MLEELGRLDLTPTMRGTRACTDEVEFAVNDADLHGGRDKRRLRDGDVVTIQTTVRRGDGLEHLGWRFSAGTPIPEDERLREASRDAIEIVRNIIRPDLHTGDI